MSECTGGGGIGGALQLCVNESSRQGNSICSPSVEHRSLAGRTTGLLKLHPPFQPPLTTLRSSGLPLDRALTEHCASKPRKSTEEREGRVGTPTLCNVLGTRRNLSIHTSSCVEVRSSYNALTFCVIRLAPQLTQIF